MEGQVTERQQVENMQWKERAVSEQQWGCREA